MASRSEEMEKLFDKIDKLSNDMRELKLVSEDVKKIRKSQLKLEKKIKKIKKAQASLKRKQVYLNDRYVDRERSSHYLGSMQNSVTNSHASVDPGTAFLAGPDEYVPEHPFSR